ncbi:MAG TPA: NAD(P)/FAD-dependent oxidoreductase [Micropepsaceae bacterium]|nr:NAD(P)/FAD-dependent oxidoreductase [Micropepsaceae bacterium]
MNTSPRTTDCIIIGAGHAGLAMSRCLSERSIDHAILERGETANSWRSERWESLRLLTPNWQSRLPGYTYDGDDPDGYRTVSEVATFISRYARVIDAPVHTHTAVTALTGDDSGYVLQTPAGEWRARAVVIASGACNIAAVPTLADAIPPQIRTLTTLDYKHPQQLEPGGVMIVGASASGVQLALEIRRAGHEVILSVGEHVRAPRMYRGRDIQWWMDASGLSDQHYDEVDDIVRARRLPSMQLIGSPEKMTLDLNALRRMGVKLVGRLAGIRGSRALFSGSLRNQCILADLKLTRLLDTFDAWVKSQGRDGEFDDPERLPPTQVDSSPPLELDLASGAIRTIIWATGYRPDYSWLRLPILDHKGNTKHDGGVTPAPGVYVMGLPFLRRRKSAFIDGAASDASDLSAHLHAFLSHSRAQ